MMLFLSHFLIVPDLLFKRLGPFEIAHNNAAIGRPHLIGRAIGRHFAGAGTQARYRQGANLLGRPALRRAIVRLDGAKIARIARYAFTESLTSSGTRMVGATTT